MSSRYLTDREIDSMRVIDLKEALSERGLPYAGLKAVLSDRLKDYMRSKALEEKQESKYPKSRTPSPKSKSPSPKTSSAYPKASSAYPKVASESPKAASIPTLNTEFTFGAEFDAGWDIHFNTKREDHYDRSIAYKKTEHLKATYDIFEKKDGMEHLDNCPYTMELALGVYKYDHICDFLNDEKNVYISNMEQNIDMFKTDILSSHNIRDILRTLYAKKVGNLDKDNAFATGKAFTNCSLTQRLDDSSKSYFYTDLKDIKDILGVPQVTIGLNYAFFPHIFNHFKNESSIGYVQKLINYILEIYNQQFPQDISWAVLKGLLYVVIYTSYIHSTYYKFEGAQYFKGSFIFKPRSNLAISYKKLKEEYPSIEKYMKMYFSALKNINIKNSIGKDNTEKLEKINSENDLYKFKLKIIEEFVSKQDDINEIDKSQIIDQVKNRTKTKKDDIFDLYSEVTALIQAKVFKNKSKLLMLLTQISSFYLLKKIINPIKAYRVKKFIREKVGGKCSNYQNILDGSIYLIDKVRNPKLYMSDYEEIDFASFFDPPSLFIKDGEICTSDQRVEIFEMVPDNSNLIVEIRSVNLFAYDDFARERPRFITLDQMGTTMIAFFDKLKSLIISANLYEFLEPCVGREIEPLPVKNLPLREQISFLSYLSPQHSVKPYQPSPQPYIKPSQPSPQPYIKPSKSVISSVMDEYMRQRDSSSESPTMSSTLNNYLNDKRASCQIMFRPKSKHKDKKKIKK